jgi:hypothetical protein
MSAAFSRILDRVATSAGQAALLAALPIAAVITLVRIL